MKKYEMLSAELKEGIRSGKYPEGKSLPTEEELSAKYSMSRQTVRKALQILVNEDLIVKRQGSGSVVKGKGSNPRSHIIAVIATYIDDYIFPGQLRAVESVLSANGYTPVLAATGNRVYSERTILEDLLNKPIDGFLIEGTKTAMPNPNFDLYARLFKRRIPVVFFNSYYPELQGTISVCADNRSGGYELVNYLLGKGHERIAGFFKSDDIQGHQRYLGYISALRDAGRLVGDEKVIWYTTESKEQILSDAEAILSRIGDSTAVVCYNDDIAIRLIRTLTQCGKRIPEDIAVASFDNSNFSEISPVRITSMSYDDRNIGSIAANKLIDILNGKKVHSESVPWTLAEKEST
ncbi:MAG: GntR family transcriptional regulator [Oscillospiraceae bacterium]|nr:GntR family transcriptional regulator [Oscillospiraceae bacterium]